MADFLTDLPLYIAAIVVILIAIYFITLRRIVPVKYADVVTRKGRVEIYSADESVTGTGKPNTVYYEFPSWIPYIGLIVKRMPLTIIQIPIDDYKTFAKGNARFVVDASVYCRINDVLEAAQKFPGNDLDDFIKGIEQIVVSSIRKTTATFAIEDVILKRSEIALDVFQDIKEDVAKWGVELTNVAIVDIRDPKEANSTTVIHDISAKKEAEINSLSRQEIANKHREAEVVEATARQASETRKIEADEIIARREQEKIQNVAVDQTAASEKQMEVKRVNTVRMAEIEADAAVKKADGEKRANIEIAEGKKLQLELEGQGKAAQTLAVGKAEADVIQAKKLAEAEGLSKFADAQKKQQEFAQMIRVIEKDEKIGLALADALGKAEIKYFGSGAPKSFMELFTPGGGLSLGGSIGTGLEVLKSTNPEGYSSIMGMIETAAKGVNKLAGGDSVNHDYDPEYRPGPAPVPNTSEEKKIGDVVDKKLIEKAKQFGFSGM
jgi:flotillin